MGEVLKTGAPLGGGGVEERPDAGDGDMIRLFWAGARIGTITLETLVLWQAMPTSAIPSLTCVIWQHPIHSKCSLNAVKVLAAISHCYGSSFS